MPTATATKLPDAPEKAHNFSDLIAIFNRALNDTREELRSGRLSGSDREMQQARVSHLRMAIQNAEEAEQITEEAVQFGSHASDFTFRVPPRIDEFKGVYGDEKARQFIGHRYLATKPLEIAWLRRLAREGHIVETGIGDMYSPPRMGRDGTMGEGIWLDAKTYDLMARNGSV